MLQIQVIKLVEKLKLKLTCATITFFFSVNAYLINSYSYIANYRLNFICERKGVKEKDKFYSTNKKKHYVSKAVVLRIEKRKKKTTTLL